MRLVLRIRKNPSAHQVMRTAMGDIAFRGVDEQALKEILVDREYAFLDRFVREMDAPHVLDVGAHIGTFAIWLLQINPQARIVSVEADPQTHEIAELNAIERRNRCPHWSTLHAAAGARDHDVVRLSDAGPSMSHRVDARGTIAVETASLATLLHRAASKDGILDLMKVDIEGSEEAFLCAAPDILAQVRALVIELHPGLCDVDRVRAELGARYDVITEIPGRNSSKPLLFCRRSKSI